MLDLLFGIVDELNGEELIDRICIAVLCRITIFDFTFPSVKGCFGEILLLTELSD